MDETLRNLRSVIARKMDFHAPYAKALLGNMLGIGPSSPQNAPQENLDVLTVQVEAVGSGKVIIPALELAPTTTVNEIKKKIFDRQESETIKHFQSYGLFIGHGGPELTDPYQQMEKVRDDYLIITVTQNEEKDRFMTAVTQYGYLLADASQTLRNDKDIVMAVVTENGYALQYAPETLRNDKDIVMAAVTQNGHALVFASETPKNDRDIVMTAVTRYGDVLRYASETLKNDKDIVTAAVTQDGLALAYASETLKNDKDIVMAAVTPDVYALRHASDTLRNDKKFITSLLIISGGRVLAHVPDALKSDRKIVARAVRQFIVNSPSKWITACYVHPILKYASTTLRNDESLLVEVSNLRFIPPPNPH